MTSLIETLWMDHEKSRGKYVLPGYHSLDTKVYRQQTVKPINYKSFHHLTSSDLTPCNYNNIIIINNNHNNSNNNNNNNLDSSNQNQTTTRTESIDWSPENVRILNCLSGYMFPQCLFIHHLNPERYLLAKVFPKNKKLSKSRELRKEKKLWQKVSTNDNFLPLYGVLEIDNSVCLLTENVPYISLKNLIGHRSLVEKDVIELSAQLVLALGYLHENNILHRGLTPEAVYLNWRGILKISDLSTCEEKGKSLSTLSGSKFSYYAPEVLLGLPYGIGSDWWSLGLIIYELLTGQVLFAAWDERLLCRRILKENCKQVLEDLVRVSFRFSDRISNEARLLLKAFLERDEKKRLKWKRDQGLKTIMEHPFFSTINWENLKNSNNGFGKVMMDLTLCSWYPDVIRVHQLLGDEFGSVYRNCHIISNHKTGEKGIMKIIWKCKMHRRRNGWKKVMNERLVWQKMSSESPYVLPMIGFFETEACYSFVTQFVANCCSLSFVIKSSPLPENVIRIMTAELTLVLHSCHQLGILLRELTPDSVLVEPSGRIWLCDFSSAKITRYSQQAHFTIEYMAPEVVQGLQYGKEADWFALGIIIFQLVVGVTPLSIYCAKKGLEEDNVSTETLLRAIETIPKLLEDDAFSPNIRSLLKDLLAFEPDKRLGTGRNCLKRIQDHPFYKGLVWKKLEQAEEFS